ncbi:hypothetical protein ACLOJK_014733 [Asimina triloba]
MKFTQALKRKIISKIVHCRSTDFGTPSSPTTHRPTHFRRGSDQSMGAVQKIRHEEMINRGQRPISSAVHRHLSSAADGSRRLPKSRRPPTSSMRPSCLHQHLAIADPASASISTASKQSPDLKF